MKKEINTSIQIILLSIFIFTAILIFDEHKKTEAQISGYTGFLIGGTTEGIDEVCCNGVKLSFDSVSPMNQFILDGEALFTPIVSTSYREGNELTQGYCTLGVNFPGVCLTVSSECYTPEYIMTIRSIGTGGATCSMI